MFVMAFAMLFIGWGVSHAAEWYLYDNFGDGSGGSVPIDTTRWDIQKDPAVDVYIIDNLLRFCHEPTGVKTSGFLVFNQSPESIKAVRALVRVGYMEGEGETCTGDAKGKIGGWFGKSEFDYFWNEISLEAPKQRISGSCGISSDTDLTDYNEFFWGKVPIPPHIIANWYVLTITFSNENKVTYAARDAAEEKGEIIYTLPRELFPTDRSFKAIGFVSESGDGGCAYYFDDVYVLRDEECQDITLVNTYSLPEPEMFPHGLAFDGTNFWMVRFEPGVIYKLQLNSDFTTQIIDTIDIMDDSVNRNFCMGLTFEGKDLWVPCHYHEDWPPTIYNVTQTGKIKNSFIVPSGGDSTGLTFDGKYLWNAGFGVGIIKMDTKGNLGDRVEFKH